MESAMNSKRGNMGEVVWELMEPINILISYRPKKQFNMTYSKLGTSVYGIFHNSKKFQTYSILYHMRPFNKTSNFSEVPSVFYERIFFVGRIGILFVNQKIFESESKYYSRFFKKSNIFQSLKRFKYSNIIRIIQLYLNKIWKIKQKKQELRFQKLIKQRHQVTVTSKHRSGPLVPANGISRSAGHLKIPNLYSKLRGKICFKY